jgi:hypothetical protein
MRAGRPGFVAPRVMGPPTAGCAGEPIRFFSAKPRRHQTSLIAGTVMQSTKLPLTVWFLAIYLISQAKTGLSALALMRQLGKD